MRCFVCHGNASGCALSTSNTAPHVNSNHLVVLLHVQVELIADELKGWADRDILQQLQQVLSQVLETQEQQKLVSGMLGL